MAVNFDMTTAEYALAAQNKEVFPGRILREIIWNFIVEKEESDISNAGRWDIGMSAIITFDNVDFYRVYWRKGLTEYQDDEYWSQVLEPVRKVKKVITLDVWETNKREQ